jgi:hypothetical protein
MVYPSEVPPDWEIIFAIGSFGGRVAGKVKLNKILAMLQCNGFPIRNQFVNHTMGPYDEKIDALASNLQSRNLISIKKHPTKHQNDIVVYDLLKKGKNQYSETILPFVSNLPYQNALFNAYKITKDDLATKKTMEVVDNIHETMLLDDIRLFRKKVESNLDELKAFNDICESNYEASCPICLELAGTLDIVIEALREIQGGKWISPLSGKNFILWNSDKIISLLKTLLTHDHIRDPRFGKDRISLFRERLCHRFQCIEYNGARYDILNPSFVSEDVQDFIEFNVRDFIDSIGIIPA